MLAQSSTLIGCGCLTRPRICTNVSTALPKLKIDKELENQINEKRKLFRELKYILHGVYSKLYAITCSCSTILF